MYYMVTITKSFSPESRYTFMLAVVLIMKSKGLSQSFINIFQRVHKSILKVYEKRYKKNQKQELNNKEDTSDENEEYTGKEADRIRIAKKIKKIKK